MQSKPCLPSIKFLLDSPIDDNHGHSYYNTPSHQTPTPSQTPTLTPTPTLSYHQPLPSISHDTHHLASINTHSKQLMLPSYNPHPSNIKSLLSPPESPEQPTYDSYGIRHEERYNVSQQQQQQQQQQQCSCCVNNKPSSLYSPTYNQQQSPISNYSPYAQRYPSFSSTLPMPITPYDRNSTISSHPLTRLNTSSLGLPIKHYSQKSLADGSSNGNRYQCPYCSKRFSRPSSLRIHIYSHTGEKPFVCTEPGCGRKFSVQSNMRRHLRVHRLGRPVKKTRYDGEVEGVKILSSAAMLRSY